MKENFKVVYDDQPNDVVDKVVSALTPFLKDGVNINELGGGDGYIEYEIEQEEDENSISIAGLIIKHGFPNGKDENYMPKFRMKNPDVDYVLNTELTKIINIIEIKQEA